MRGRGPAAAERDVCPPRSPDLNPLYLLLCRDLKDQACAGPPMAVDDFVAIIEYIIACSRICSVAHCHLPWNRWRPFRKHTAITRQPLNDHLMPCDIWRRCFKKPHISEHVLCNSCDFLTMNNSLESAWENFVAPYTQAKEGTNLTNKFEWRGLETFFYFSLLLFPNKCLFLWFLLWEGDVKWSEYCACHF